MRSEGLGPRGIEPRPQALTPHPFPERFITMHNEIAQMFELTGQVAFVVGGARDLGFDAACTLAGAGADVIITSRTAASSEASADKLREKYGVNVLPLAVDQTEFVQVAAVVEKAAAWKGRIDVLVNNAGGGSGKSAALLFERDPADIDGLIQLNLNGMLYCCRQVGPVMAKRGRGKIINIASIAGLVGRDRKMYERNDMLGQPIDYAAAKAGVIGATLDLAAYMAPMGIFVNAISPGGFNRNLPDTFVCEYSNATAMGRMGRDGIDLNGAILFLASAASDYVTGQNLVVDGGFTLWH